MTKQLPVLIKRELQEHRWLFIYLPLILSGLLAVAILSGLRFMGTQDEHGYSVQIGDGPGQHDQFMQPFSGDAMKSLSEMAPAKRQSVIDKAYLVMTTPLLVALWMVALTYPLVTLYNERKDRSILFWKSMPVSDAMTVAAKLISVAVVLPLIYLVCIMFVHIIALLVSSITAWHQSIDVWNTLWAPSHILSRWLDDGAWLALASVWYLPMFAWLLLVSSWARSVPAVWAAVIPFGLHIAERVVSPYHWISGWIGDYSWPLGLWQKQTLHAVGSLSLMLNPEMVVSLLIAAAMLYGAVYMRGRTDEI